MRKIDGTRGSNAISKTIGAIERLTQIEIHSTENRVNVRDVIGHRLNFDSNKMSNVGRIARPSDVDLHEKTFYRTNRLNLNSICHVGVLCW